MAITLRSPITQTKQGTIIEVPYVPLTSKETSSIELKEKFEGSIVKQDVKFPRELGVEHPFDFKQVEDLYKTYGFVTAVVDKYVDFIVGPGFFIKSEDPRAIEILEQFMRDVDFDTFLRAWVKEALIKGTGFAEISYEDKSPNGLRVLDSKYMYIAIDDQGNYLKNPYRQFIGYSNNFNIRNNKIKEFPENKVVHISFNKVGDNVYGCGIVYPALNFIDNHLGALKEMHILMQRKANAPIQAKLGGVVGDQVFRPSSGDVEAFGQKLEWLHNKHEWATDFLVDMKVLDFGQIGEKFAEILNHDEDMLFFTFQVPEVLMGRGSIPEGLASVQMDAFQRRIQSMQAEIEKIIEKQIFKKILNANGLDVHVEFEWGQPSTTEINAKITKLTELLKLPFIDPRLKARLEQDLAQTLGYEENLLEEPLEEREREETQPQPIVPGSNREEHLIEEKEITLREWLGFNYRNYLDFIEKVLNEEKFELITAKNLEEIGLGRLTSGEVESVRSVLKKGFRRGSSIRDMTNDLNRRVSFKDLYIERNGDRVLHLSANLRANIIARTETTRIANLGALKNYENSGFNQYSWVAAVSDRTCPICEGLNGKIFITNQGQMPPAHTSCYDKETEVFTENGWKLFKDVDPNEKILTLNPDTKDLELSEIKEIIKYESSCIFELTNKQKSFNMAITEDHPFFVYTRVDHGKEGRKLEHKFINGIKNLNSESKFYLSSQWKGIDNNKIKVDTIEFNTTDFCKFMGYYLSEGSVTLRKKGGYQISIAQEHYLDEFYDDIKNMPFKKVYLGKDKIYIFDQDMAKYLLQFGKSFDKFIPKEIKGLDLKYIRLFLDAYLMGDGHIAKGSFWKGYTFRESKSYSTSSKRMADDLGELIIKSGNSVSYDLIKCKGKIQEFKNGKYKINNNQWRINELNGKFRQFSNMIIKKKKYKDLVYDLELKNNHTLLTRRKGKVVWGSNCRCTIIPVTG